MGNQLRVEDQQLIDDLYGISKKSPKLVRSSLYDAPADLNIKVRSWKMNEFKYYQVPSPFPTLARGLFTEEVDEIGEKKCRIICRGYDKFFNIGEVPWTNWDGLEGHTSPPYTLTLKSNGCIIFIGALTPSKLLITSKHSLGAVGDKNESHAQRGEWWLKKQFEKTGRTEEEMAKTLWNQNWTAVAELCDDSFEEHVLPYPPEKTGLHLHGLNESTAAFHTLPPSTVNAFAAEWGFIPTPAHTVNSISEVQEFTCKAGETGSWNGEPVEGFVVRTHVKDSPSKDSRNAPPYPPGSTFFFKVKFDEPYMMYRDWREVTKVLLRGKSPSELPKAKMKRPETKLYVNWVQEEIKRDRKQFDGFASGKGIIATRERFLEWLGGQEGKKALGGVKKVGEEAGWCTDSDGVDGKGKEAENEFGKTIIVPVAIPGVGKTSVAVALVHLFGFGHTQSDDVKAKKAAPVFIKNVLECLKHHDVVIADKNNHLRQHRQQLRDAVKNMSPPVRLLALNWTLDQPPAAIHRICGDRVLARGTNHQTLHGDSLAKAHEDIIWKFLEQAEELSDEEVDVSIEMDLAESLEEAVNRAVEGCVRVLGVERPSEVRIKEALDLAAKYAPATKEDKGQEKKDKSKAEKAMKPPRYFGLLPKIDLEEVFDRMLGDEAVVSKEARAFHQGLKSNGRVTKRPHVTVIHSKSITGEEELWERCMEMQRLPTGPLFEIDLKNVVWNDRVMALTVDNIRVVAEDGQGQQGAEFVCKLPEGVRKRLHITVGTENNDVNPYEAKGLVEEWRAGKIGSLEMQGIKARGRLKGLNS